MASVKTSTNNKNNNENFFFMGVTSAAVFSEIKFLGYSYEPDGVSRPCSILLFQF